MIRRSGSSGNRMSSSISMSPSLTGSPPNPLSSNTPRSGEGQFRSAVEDAIEMMNTDSFIRGILVLYDNERNGIRTGPSFVSLKDKDQLLDSDVVYKLFERINRTTLLNNMSKVVNAWVSQCPIASIACNELTTTVISAMKPKLNSTEEQSIRLFLCIWIWKALREMYVKEDEQRAKDKTGGGPLGDLCVFAVLLPAMVPLMIMFPTKAPGIYDDMSRILKGQRARLA